MAEDSKKIAVIPGPARERESTLSLILPDPRVDKFTFLNASLRLHTMRQFLSPFSITEDHDRSGMDYPVFLRHMIGMKTLTLESKRLDFVKTTSAIFLVSETAEAIATINGALPDLDTGKRYVLSDGSQTIHLCRFTGAEFELIEKAARESVDLPELKRTISESAPITSDTSFDAASFVAGIRRASSYRDELDRKIFILDHDDGSTYTMYSGVNPSEREENPLMYVGRFENTNYYIFRVEVIG